MILLLTLFSLLHLSAWAENGPVESCGADAVISKLIATKSSRLNLNIANSEIAYLSDYFKKIKDIHASNLKLLVYKIDGQFHFLAMPHSELHRLVQPQIKANNPSVRYAVGTDLYLYITRNPNTNKIDLYELEGQADLVFGMTEEAVRDKIIGELKKGLSQDLDPSAVFVEDKFKTKHFRTSTPENPRIQIPK